MKSNFAKIALLTGWVLMLSVSPALAQGRMDELRGRMEARYPEILKLKDAGQIGETAAGYLDAVEARFASDGNVARVIREENADRQELYQAIANHEKVPVQAVAERSARRNFERAHKGDYLKGPDGKWTRKG